MGVVASSPGWYLKKVLSSPSLPTCSRTRKSNTPSRKPSPAASALHRLDADLVIDGILEVIDLCRKAGMGAWQANVQLKAWEMLGRYVGIFNQVDLGWEQKRTEQLEAGRKRAARLLARGPKPEQDAVTEQKAATVLDSLAVDDESKPN